MPSTLREIVENKRREVAELQASGTQPTPPRARGTFLPALQEEGTRIIAEIKPKSPSAGTLNASVDLGGLTRTYSRYAAAISVLTDEKYFGGTMESLRTVATNTNVPALCKDFILHSVQIDQARNAGAEAVLLIVKILDATTLRELHEKIVSLNMVPVVEVQNEEELSIALSVEPRCILINNRDLETFEIDLATTERLAPKIPKHIQVISASGVEERTDIERLQKYTNCFLVGSSLMRSPAIDRKLRELVGVKQMVKVCGITSAKDAELAIDAGADLLGLIFVKESPRAVDGCVAHDICNQIGGDKCVGVFKDWPATEIESMRERVGFKYVQLHGNESAAEVALLPHSIKAVTVRSEEDVRAAEIFQSANLILFDLPKDNSGSISIEQAVDWINGVQPTVPFLLAGGLNGDNVAKIVERVQSPNFLGVDVASGVESQPGIKGPELVKRFIMEATRHAITR
jgi:indole-3-glycerol phosphate synthase / phosphoribosylanthranilate isomerase